jgi:hypothetical protein
VGVRRALLPQRKLDDCLVSATSEEGQGAAKE